MSASKLKNPMGPVELSHIRLVLGHGDKPLSQAAIGAIVFRERETIAAYEAGRQPIPALVAVTLRRAARELQTFRADAPTLVLGTED